MSDLNLNNVFVSDSGRVQFSGVKSGIDFIDVVDKMVEARRIPATTLETRITENDTKKAALQDLQTRMSSLQTAMENLYGDPSFDNSSDLFESKLAFASTARTDSTEPAAATNLIGVTVTNNAVTGERTLEIEQKAEAQKLATSAFAGTTTDAVGVSGTITIGTASGTNSDIDVLATDSLADIRDRINATTDNSGVSATVVQASATESYLVLNADGEGMDNRITTLSDTGNVLSTLGLDNSGGITSDTVTGGTLTSDLTLMVDGNEYSFTAGQTLTDIETTLTGAGIGASVASDQLTITGTSDVHEKSGSIGLAVAGQLTGAQNAQLRVDGLSTTVERSTNTIDDLFDGMTINILDAEDDTTITLSIEADTTSVNNALVDFVNAYNEVQSFINEMTYVDPVSGEADEDAVLFGNPTVNAIETALQNAIGNAASGVDPSNGFATLSSIGIDFAPTPSLNATREEALTANTLEIDTTTLEDALVNNMDDVRDLFAFDYSSSNPDVVLLDFDGNTSYQNGGYALELNFDGSGNINGGSIDGDNAAFDFSGSTITANSNTGANGLKLIYTGDGAATENATINVTVGIGAQLFFELDNLLDETSGSLSTSISDLETQNEGNRERIEDLDERLTLYREGLLDQFIAMESALAMMQSTMSSLGELMSSGSS